jgi:hypothetical protein
MLCDETAESAGKNARELGAALVGAHAFRVTPGVRFDVFVVGHGHYGDPAKRGPSEMTYAVCSRVLRKVITRGSQFATVRDRTSGADPGGSDRSSGTDPVLTRHPARRETRRDFRPIRSASGGVRATTWFRPRDTARPPTLAHPSKTLRRKRKTRPR